MGHAKGSGLSTGQLFLRISALVITAVAALWLTGASPSAGLTLDSEEQTLFTLINDYRERHDLPPLAPSIALGDSAAWMAQDMAANDYFSHIDSLARGPFQRMADFGYDYSTWKGENLAAAAQTAEKAFALWKGSLVHQANLLNADFKVIGIGRAYNDASTYGWYWVADFGGYLDSTCSKPDSDGDGLGDACDSTPLGVCDGLAVTNRGTKGDDSLTGTPSRDVIHGGAGDDVIDLLAGDDFACGGSGNDTIYGRDGTDMLLGQRGIDTLSGGRGDDTETGSYQNDRLLGGYGNDDLKGGDGDDALDGGADSDSCDGGPGTNTAVTCETTMNVP